MGLPKIISIKKKFATQKAPLASIGQQKSFGQITMPPTVTSKEVTSQSKLPLNGRSSNHRDPAFLASVIGTEKYESSESLDPCSVNSHKWSHEVGECKGTGEKRPRLEPPTKDMPFLNPEEVICPELFYLTRGVFLPSYLGHLWNIRMNILKK